VEASGIWGEEVFQDGLFNESVANQAFRRTCRNSDFFETHVHLGTLTFQKIRITKIS
jgi:hypothetical protein